mmetsp:Transcript_5510/g.15831  ORF Transcript_5510/g.15831 Transcript_5510/m.15831 type:complete len:115 (-) Transcript_5510:43-387(-)
MDVDASGSQPDSWRCGSSLELNHLRCVTSPDLVLEDRADEGQKEGDSTIRETSCSSRDGWSEGMGRDAGLLASCPILRLVSCPDAVLRSSDPQGGHTGRASLQLQLSLPMEALA